MRLLYYGIGVTYLLLGGGSFLPRHCRKALRASTLGTIASSCTVHNLRNEPHAWQPELSVEAAVEEDVGSAVEHEEEVAERSDNPAPHGERSAARIVHEGMRHIISLSNYCLSGRDVISDLLVSLISKWPRYSRHCRGALARTAAEVISRKPLVVAYPLICWANVFWVPRAYFLPESQELFSKPITTATWKPHGKAFINGVRTHHFVVRKWNTD